MRWFFILISIASLRANGQVLEKLLKQQDSSIKEVHPKRSIGNKDIFIAVLIIEKHWWEELKIVKFQHNKIIWNAIIDSPLDEQSIYQIKEKRLKGFSHPCLEIYGQTHQGNGFYYLYQEKWPRIHLIAKTRAVDFHESPPSPIESDRLLPIYKDLNHDGYSDILLEGTTKNGEKLKKVLIYNRLKNVFIEDRSRRKGMRFWRSFDD